MQEYLRSFCIYQISVFSFVKNTAPDFIQDTLFGLMRKGLIVLDIVYLFGDNSERVFLGVQSSDCAPFLIIVVA